MPIFSFKLQISRSQHLDSEPISVTASNPLGSSVLVHLARSFSFPFPIRLLGGKVIRFTNHYIDQPHSLFHIYQVYTQVSKLTIVAATFCKKKIILQTTFHDHFKVRWQIFSIFLASRTLTLLSKLKIAIPSRLEGQASKFGKFFMLFCIWVFFMFPNFVHFAFLAFPLPYLYFGMS